LADGCWVVALELEFVDDAKRVWAVGKVKMVGAGPQLWPGEVTRLGVGVFSFFFFPFFFFSREAW
jgi:hypothetical protein